MRKGTQKISYSTLALEASFGTVAMICFKEKLKSADIAKSKKSTD